MAAKRKATARRPARLAGVTAVAGPGRCAACRRKAKVLVIVDGRPHGQDCAVAAGASPGEVARAVAALKTGGQPAQRRAAAVPKRPGEVVEQLGVGEDRVVSVVATDRPGVWSARVTFPETGQTRDLGTFAADLDDPRARRDALAEAGRRATAHQPSPPGGGRDVTENDVRRAWAELSAEQGHSDWVGIARLRHRLGNPANFDAAVRRLTRTSGDASIVPESNQKALTDDDRAGAIVIGGQARHAITLNPAGPAPARPAQEAAGRAERTSEDPARDEREAAAWARLRRLGADPEREPK